MSTAMTAISFSTAEPRRSEGELPDLLARDRATAMGRALRALERAAKSRSTVLLLGESGVGKEVAARAIHRWSPRADKPFVVVNCAALSPTLLESELFGHERGSFTGAQARKEGKFEFAAGGTLFLDEIGELAAPLQAKLLRVLQDGEFQRVGGNETLRPDVRLVAATNRDLKAEVAAGRFRKDLFFRLNVISAVLPPLRERRDEIPALVERFLARAKARHGRREITRVCQPAMAALLAYDWPGNVRELSNVIERAVVLAPSSEITVDDLPDELKPGGQPDFLCEESGELSLAEVVRIARKRAIENAMARCDGHQANAAKLLGVHPSCLSRMIRQASS